MEWVWILVGAGVTWFVMRFRATKAAVRREAQEEVASCVLTMAAWNEDRESPEALQMALGVLAIYEARRELVQQGGPGGDAKGALMASYWLKTLVDMQFLSHDRKPILWHDVPRSFWESIEALRDIKTHTALQSYYSDPEACS